MDEMNPNKTIIYSFNFFVLVVEKYRVEMLSSAPDKEDVIPILCKAFSEKDHLTVLSGTTAGMISPQIYVPYCASQVYLPLIIEYRV